MSHIENSSRRDLLKGGLFAGAALVLGCQIPPPAPPPVAAPPASPAAPDQPAAALPSATFAPNVFLRIDTQDHVTLWLTKPEMGQGVHTSLPMLVAEELEVEFSTITFERAEADEKYGDQGIVGSASVREGFLPFRKAGAAARMMLISAAAAKWGVSEDACRAEKGAVLHPPTSRKLRYGELVESASKLPVPSEVRLKDPRDFRLIGTRVGRTDSPAKVGGAGQFGIDMRVPGMLYATVLQSPVFGGKPASVDEAEALKFPGVRRVEKLPGAVAVIADNTWAAMQGRDALKVTWDEGPAAGLSSATIHAAFEAAAKSPAAAQGRADGDAKKALGAAKKKLSAVYETPYLAHAPMEPMSCVADVRKDVCELWVPSQYPAILQKLLGQALGISPATIKIHLPYLGGGFGRRGEVDYVIQAAMLSRAAGAPVKLTWSREEDTQHDFYRPASYHALEAGLDGAGHVVAFTHRIVAQSIMAQHGMPLDKAGLDRQAVEGAANMAYAVPAVRVDYVLAKNAVPVGWWRSVFNAQNAFAIECFLDELAAASGRDPVALRRELLEKAPRHRAALDLVAQKAGWGSPLSPLSNGRGWGRGRGIAVHECFNTVVAQVAEVTVSPTGAVKVDRIVSVVDCGIVVNPMSAEAQIEGAIVYGLSAALKGAITIEKGRVQQSNFDDYPVLRMSEMPALEVHFIQSSGEPGGLGEPGVPPTAPAVVNAVFAATGKRIRRLPIRAEDLVKKG